MIFYWFFVFAKFNVTVFIVGDTLNTVASLGFEKEPSAAVIE